MITVAVSPTDVEELRRLVVVGRDDFQISEITESLLNRAEAFGCSDPGEDLLANGSDEDCLTRSDEPGPLLGEQTLLVVQSLGSPT